MRTVAILAVVASLARAACVAVPSGNILARDLFAAIPLFQALDPQAMVGFAPYPGTVRVLSSHDVILIGRRYGLAFPPGETAPIVCIERVVRQLSAGEVREALLSALNNDSVQLDLLEFSSQSFPPGRLEFDRGGLQKPPAGNPQIPVIWRGSMTYDDHRSLAVWAKLRASVQGEIAVARETILPGAVIRAEQVNTRRVSQFPVLGPSPALPLQIAGKVARHLLAAGQRITSDALEDLQDVIRGDTVHVRVVFGGATIGFDAIAQSSGQKGQVIVVHNPTSGRNFRGLIAGRAEVIVPAAVEGAL
jgi:flagella basal body P-ring formation protein FlgA